MALTPWYKVVAPREDLREGKPLDAAEFAVHLDKVREGSAPSVYTQPSEFFDRTYMTRNLLEVAGEVVRRLAGDINEASAVFNLTTQFGGGKTHALTLLYHLAQHGPAAMGWRGVNHILEAAGVSAIPQAAVAVFVGQQFDALKGRGGDDGTPQRFTPWGEIAWQLGGAEAFAAVAQHDSERVAPAGDVIRTMLPADQPVLILMDELMNFVSANRRSGLSTQFYNFMQNLSEEVRGRSGVVLAVSVPASELEMNPEDEADYQRLSKLISRLGKLILISAEHETSEIIRRRLFVWNDQDVQHKEVVATIKAYASWAAEHSGQLSEPMGEAQAFELFKASYPFHPAVLSVFERKWQTLPRFQRTRGVLQLLARWVSKSYREGYDKVQADALIELGGAPLDDPNFRAAVFEQLGENRLEAAVITDIAGSEHAFASLLDREAQPVIAKARLHRKAATAVFFESNGGQRSGKATLPEIRLAVGGPSVDLGNIETALDALAQSCHYLTVEGGSYRFSIRPNLIKMHTDRRASVRADRVHERVREEVRQGFDLKRAQQELQGARVRLVLFPDNGTDIADVPELSLVVLAPGYAQSDPQTIPMIQKLTEQYGASVRRFRNSLVWCLADDPTPLLDVTRRVLAWEDIQAEADSATGDGLLDSGQLAQLIGHLQKARSELREAVWRAYRHVRLLNRNGEMIPLDLGLVHSSAAQTLVNLVVNRLIAQGDAVDKVSYSFLTRNWPAQAEWGTASVQQAFFASPQFPRLLRPDAVSEAIASGVASGELAYASRAQNGHHAAFHYREMMSAGQVEISDEMCILRKADAEAYLARIMTVSAPEPGKFTGEPGPDRPVAPVDSWGTNEPSEPDAPGETTTPWGPPPTATHLGWRGEVPPQKWTMFYQRVLSRFAAGSSLRLTIEFSADDASGVSAQKIEETRQALKDLGLDGRVDVG